jgi:hypothetical protein
MLEHVLAVAIVWGALGPLVVGLVREGRPWAPCAGMGVGLTLVLVALNRVGSAFAAPQLGVWAGAIVVAGLGVWASLATSAGGHGER